MAFSHFPFFCTGCLSKNTEASAKWYAGAEAEYRGALNMTDEARRKAAQAGEYDGACAAESGQSEDGEHTCPDELLGWGKSQAQGTQQAVADLVKPLLHAYGVDLYIAGHWHYYESLFPSEIGADGNGGKILQKNFTDPQVTVHVTSGNGGPPGKDNFCEVSLLSGLLSVSTLPSPLRIPRFLLLAGEGCAGRVQLLRDRPGGLAFDAGR